MDWAKVADYLDAWASKTAGTAYNLMEMTGPANPVVQSSQTAASIAGAIARALRAGLLAKQATGQHDSLLK